MSAQSVSVQVCGDPTPMSYQPVDQNMIDAASKTWTTTVSNAINVQPNQGFTGQLTIGGWGGEQTWIGDFPPNHGVVPNPTYIPPNQGVVTLPYIMDGSQQSIGYIQQIATPIPAWRIVPSSDRVVASVDMPGIKAVDIKLEIESGTIKVTARRFDTNVPFTTSYCIGHDYDPRSAVALLEYGVLTLDVMRFKEKIVHSVTVTEK